MTRLFTILIILLAIYSCGDGDVLEFDLDFDQDLELCGNIDSETYLVYDVRTDPSESLIALFPGSDSNDKIFFPEVSPTEGSIAINGSTVRFNYRAYNGDPLEIICQDIPSSEVRITTDYEASSGVINYTTTFTDENGIRTVTVVFNITDTDIEVLRSDLINLGIYTHSYSIEN